MTRNLGVRIMRGLLHVQLPENKRDMGKPIARYRLQWGKCRTFYSMIGDYRLTYKQVFLWLYTVTATRVYPYTGTPLYYVDPDCVEKYQ